MALGKYQRLGTRKSSSYSSTGVVIAFVAVCLVGVWMSMSPSVAPDRNEISQDAKAEVAGETATEIKSRQFEDSQGDLPEDAIKGDSNSIPEVQDNHKAAPDQHEESLQGDKSDKDNGHDKGGGSDETSNAQTESNYGGEQKAAEEAESKTEPEETQTQTGGQAEPVENPMETKKVENKADENQEQHPESSSDNKKDSSDSSQGADEVFPDVAHAEILNETTTQNGSFSTQCAESKNEKEKRQPAESEEADSAGYIWKLCNVTAGPDYIPCLDNVQALKKLKTTRHYEHRERHCPEEPPTCLVALPEGYKRSIEWPNSRDKIWYHNVPHTTLAEVKGHQNWVKVTGEYLTFPGGGTQFMYGASHYIEFLEQGVPEIAWGKQSRVVLDVGCGVASFGGYLFDKDVLTMSLAPKDEHEAQVQFALERGIPAISAVMGTKRLPFPGNVFDAIHCARCRVPWHIEGGKLLLELNRMLRPGGYFLWSATPVYQKLPEDVEIWDAMTELTKKMCWELVTIKEDKVDFVGAAIYRKPLTNECYENRQENDPPLCKESDDPNAAYNVSLQACMHKIPVGETARGSHWPEQWPLRLERPPYWLTNNQVGVYGKAAPEDFISDYKHWKHVVTKSYLSGMGISWSKVRNVMDMRSIYGGFAAALKDLNVWVMNVVTIDSPDTLPIIYERGLFGIYHDWCESFSTYPRSYDLLHADHLFSKLKKRCSLVAVMAEVDRVLRPEGKLIVRDNVEIINEIQKMAKSLQWEIRLTYSKDAEGLLCVQKTMWRPKEMEVIASATV